MNRPSAPSERDGVMVLGMHRSGTSAITRVVNLLGVPLAHDDDLIAPRRPNPDGYWESASLVEFNDALLGEYGGSAWEPPDPDQMWPSASRRPDLLSMGRDTFGSVHGQGSWVWKDPRNCLTLPFWRSCLQPTWDLACIFVYRHPHEVARSLSDRDGVSIRYGIALWDYYTITALRALDGLPVHVVNYASFIQAPLRAAQAMHDFLRRQGCTLPPPSSEAIRDFVRQDGRGQRRRHPIHGRRLSRSTERLWCHLDGLSESAAFDSSCLPPPLMSPKQISRLYRRTRHFRRVRRAPTRLRRLPIPPDRATR